MYPKPVCREIRARALVRQEPISQHVRFGFSIPKISEVNEKGATLSVVFLSALLFAGRETLW